MVGLEARQLNLEKNDEVLMLEYQKGDLNAFNLIYARYSKKLYGYLFNKLKSEQDVNEVFQAVFLKLHQAKHQFNPKQKFSPWFFSISYTVAIDFIRKRKNTLEISEKHTIQANNQWEINYFELLDTLKKTDLTKKECQAIKMKYIEGHDYNFISNEIKLGNSATRKLVSRAISKLRLIFN